MTDLGVMKMKAGCGSLPKDQSVDDASESSCGKSCVHLFYLLRGNPAVNARATQNN